MIEVLALYAVASSVVGMTVAGMIASDREVRTVIPLVIGITSLLLWPLAVFLAFLSLPVLAGTWIGRQFA